MPEIEDKHATAVDPAQLEIDEPEVDEPKVDEPEVDEHEVDEHKIDEHEISEPEVEEHEIIEHQIAGHEITKHDIAEPEQAELENVELVSVESVAEEPVAPDAVPAAEELPAAEGNPNLNWYIIHTYSGFENKVAESLKSRAEAFGFDHRLGQILIPKEQVVEMKNGKKVTSDRMLYPGYVMVQMEMDDQLWHEVKNTPRVTGFVGGGNTPVPLTADEVNKILFRQARPGDAPRPKVNYEKNETVRIVDGPFNNFSGKVDEVNTDRNTLRVMVTIFGRSTPVELDFLQVEKV